MSTRSKKQLSTRNSTYNLRQSILTSPNRVVQRVLKTPKLASISKKKQETLTQIGYVVCSNPDDLDLAHDDEGNGNVEEKPRVRKRRKIIKEPQIPVGRQTRSSKGQALATGIGNEDDGDEDEGFRSERDENQVQAKESSVAFLAPLPKTPQFLRPKEIPSSQSPADTHLSTQSRRSVRDASRSPLKVRSTNIPNTSIRVLPARKCVRSTPMLEIADSMEENCKAKRVFQNSLEQTSRKPIKLDQTSENNHTSRTNSTLSEKGSISSQQRMTEGRTTDSCTRTQNFKSEVSDTDAEDEDDDVDGGDFEVGVGTQTAFGTYDSESSTSMEGCTKIYDAWTPRPALTNPKLLATPEPRDRKSAQVFGSPNQTNNKPIDDTCTPRRPLRSSGTTATPKARYRGRRRSSSSPNHEKNSKLVNDTLTPRRILGDSELACIPMERKADSDQSSGSIDQPNIEPAAIGSPAWGRVPRPPKTTTTPKQRHEKLNHPPRSPKYQENSRRTPQSSPCHVLQSSPRHDLSQSPPSACSISHFHSKGVSSQPAKEIFSHTQLRLLPETESQFENAWHDYIPGPGFRDEDRDSILVDESNNPSHLPPCACDDRNQPLPFGDPHQPTSPHCTVLNLPKVSSLPQNPSSTTASSSSQDTAVDQLSCFYPLQKFPSSPPPKYSPSLSSSSKPRKSAAIDTILPMPEICSQQDISSSATTATASSQATSVDITQPPSCHHSAQKNTTFPTPPPRLPSSSSPIRIRAAIDGYADEWNGLRLTDSQLLPESLVNGSLVGPPLAYEELLLEDDG